MEDYFVIPVFVVIETMQKLLQTKLNNGSLLYIVPFVPHFKSNVHIKE